MADVLTSAQRRKNMAAIKSKDTKPELAVRRVAHSLGYRYALHKRDLPGKPDLTLTKHRKVILVHGCYWHMHNCRYGCVAPKTNARFWRKKRESNVERDRRIIRDLRKLNWKVLVIWECQTRDLSSLEKRLQRFLRDS